MSIITTGIASRFKGDKMIWLIVALLSLLSLIMIYSSTRTLAYRKHGGDTEFYLIKQVFILGGGLVFMFLCHLVNYTRLSRLIPVMLGVSVLMLLYTIVSGASVNQASRWIGLPGINLTFQTSDLAKLALILYVAKSLGDGADFWRIFIPIIVVCGLIVPANLSTGGLLFATCVFMMFIGSNDLSNLWTMLLLGLAAFAMMILLADVFPTIRVNTWISRIQNFISGENNSVSLQVEQAKIAIAKGGLIGVGPGNGTQSNFLPNAFSDYIYCIIIEEFGLIGGFAVIAMYLGLLIRCVRLVTRSPKAFGGLLALGLCISLVLQAFANMAVSVNLIPVTGVTLPLISLGGTSLLFTCISIGLMLSVSRYMDDSALANNPRNMMNN